MALLNFYKKKNKDSLKITILNQTYLTKAQKTQIKQDITDEINAGKNYTEVEKILCQNFNLKAVQVHSCPKDNTIYVVI